MHRIGAAAVAVAGLLACGDPAPDERAAAAEGRMSSTGAAPLAGGTAHTLSVTNAVAAAPVRTGDAAPPVAVYFVVMNPGARADTLDAVDVAGARATIHDQVLRAGGRVAMQPVDAAAIPAGEMLRFVPGGRHVMLDGYARTLAAGDTIVMTLVFRHAGRTPVTARVIDYRNLDSAIAAGADEHAGH